MCGIVGAASLGDVVDSTWLRCASLALVHRGPDDAGEWWSSSRRVGLAHRRLSIIDLSSAGHQPMSSPEYGLVIVFNGEIYNFKSLQKLLKLDGYYFRSNSDTEVILAAYDKWGEECVHHLNGMFAFSIYDLKRNKIYIARDRAGEKPLFYHFKSGTLRFASELKALLADSNLQRNVDLFGLNQYLSNGYVSGANCLLEGFNKLPAGSILTFDLNTGTLHNRKYWSPPMYVEDECKKYFVNELQHEVERLLFRAVECQLVADVPVGILLSGGLDSSLITALAARISDKVRTFSVILPGHGSLDESKHARLISRHFSTEHTELEANDSSVDLLPQIAKYFDEPIADSSVVPSWIVSNLVRKHCTVVLGGDGGDELFGGYKHYSQQLQLSDNVRYIPLPLRRMLSNITSKVLPVGFRGRSFSRNLATDFSTNVLKTQNFFDPCALNKLYPNLFDKKLYKSDLFNRKYSDKMTLADRAMRFDFDNYLVDDILVKVDRASMANSLEVRSPFLDKELLEFAFSSIPASAKVDGNARKVLLKQIARRILPQGFDVTRKQGFSIPLKSWLTTGKYRELFNDILSSADSSFDRSYVQKLLRSQDKGRSNSERLFAIVQFELWRKEYKVSL